MGKLKQTINNYSLCKKLLPVICEIGSVLLPDFLFKKGFLWSHNGFMIALFLRKAGIFIQENNSKSAALSYKVSLYWKIIKFVLVELYLLMA